MERVYHTWDKWECFPAGFYDPKPPAKDMTIEQCKQAYATFLQDAERFRAAALRVVSEWRFSAEHYLTNERMNRIAWMGQASMCIETRVSKFFCGGYFLLSEQEQVAADQIALDVINVWMAQNGHDPINMAEALGRTQADLY